MIKLEVRDYCQKCPSFDPEVVSRPETVKYVAYDPYEQLDSIEKQITATYTRGDTIVVCRYRNKCGGEYKNDLG